MQPRVPEQGNKPSKPLVIKPFGNDFSAGDTPSHRGECAAETHRVLQCAQAHTPRNLHQKGPSGLWKAGEGTESQPTAKPAALIPLEPHLNLHSHNGGIRLPHLGEYLRLGPSEQSKHADTKKNWPA